jgi:hypothetical protein
MGYLCVFAFCGDSARAERMTTECVPSYGGAHEELGSSERPESTHTENPSPDLRPYKKDTENLQYSHITAFSRI